MKAILIDDEKPNLDNLQAMLRMYCPQVNVIATAFTAETGKALLAHYQPDLLFLDVQMPDQNGFDLLRSLPTYDFEVIIVTAYDQYAIQAMRLAAVDYLLKPVDITELQTAVEKAIKQRRLKVQNGQLDNLIQLLKTRQTKEEQRIALATARETRLVKIDEIVRCESSNNYTTVYLREGDGLLVCKPIYEYEDLLKTYGFLRCHQTHLVNKTYIKSWKKEYGDFLLLADGTEIPISRGKKETVRQALHLA